MERPIRWIALVLLLGGLLGPLATPAAEPAPGYTGLPFDPPAPGTYDLPPIKPAADGRVLRANGEPARLHDLFGDKLVVLSFIYTHCHMANGCPLSSFVLSQVKRRLAQDPRLAANVRLVTLSFDPEQDTPRAMAKYRDRFTGGDRPGEWRFLTTPSRAALEPILAAYDQVAEKEYQAGEWTGKFNHILRVFLIDRQKRIRNIYNISFLHPRILVNDIRTLLQGEGETPDGAGKPDRDGPAASWLPAAHAAPPPAAGTDRGRASAAERERTLDRLMALVRDPPVGLPPVAAPEDNPVTRAKVRLGRRLFLDRRLSLNDTISCAMCHVPEQGFTHNELKTAVGLEGRTVRRNAPTLLNVAYFERFFHDARENRLAHQVWGRLLARREMANASVGQVIEKIRRMPDYDGLFEAAFGEGPNIRNIGQAIASFERTLLAGGSPFDRWYYGGEEDALGAAAKRGFRLFTGKAGCEGCHRIGADHALFTDQRVHNTGVGWFFSRHRAPATRQVPVAPGVTLTTPSAVIEQFGEPPPNDLGLYEVTQNPADRWRYKTPSLRNVALTAPYMHNGAFDTLAEVVRFYNRGGYDHPLLDSRIRPLGLDDGEIRDLVAFLESLTAGNVGDLIRAVRAVPVGDLGPEDPHWSHDNRIPYGRPGAVGARP
jgi:cytochrome c peroxidase